MSGLYNMLMGKNPAYPMLMAIVGICQKNFQQMGRLRDAWISADAKTIGILHRNYGEDGQAANDAAAALPTFKEGGSCSDHTYGFWLFNVPKEGTVGDLVAKKIAEVSDNTPCWKRYEQALKDMQAGKDTPQTKYMLEVGEKIADDLTKSLEDGKPRSVQTEDGGVDIITPQGLQEVRCPTCKSIGFPKSVLSDDRCTFCDGTEGGHEPDVTTAKEDEALAGINREKEPIVVAHALLERCSENSGYRSGCPVCKAGTLSVRRDPETHEIVSEDNCVLCGQRFIYTDLGRKA